MEGELPFGKEEFALMIDQVDGKVEGQILRLAHSNTIIKRGISRNENAIDYSLSYVYYLLSLLCIRTRIGLRLESRSQI